MSLIYLTFKKKVCVQNFELDYLYGLWSINKVYYYYLGRQTFITYM